MGSYLINDTGNAPAQQWAHYDRESGIGRRIGMSAYSAADNTVASHQDIDIKVNIGLKG